MLGPWGLVVCGGFWRVISHIFPGAIHPNLVPGNLTGLEVSGHRRLGFGTRDFPVFEHGAYRLRGRGAARTCNDRGSIAPEGMDKDRSRRERLGQCAGDGEAAVITSEQDGISKDCFHPLLLDCSSGLLGSL